MSKSRILTYTQPVAAAACEDQRELFKDTFGDAVEVTEELATQYAEKFDFDCAAKTFLTDAASAEYEKVEAAAYAKYTKVSDAARAEYYKASAVTFAKLYIAESN